MTAVPQRARPSRSAKSPFTFSSNEPGSTFTCSLDGGTPQACNSGSKTYSAIGEGPHTFSVTATDPAPFSNADPTPATRNFTFTDPPPETTIDSGPAEGSTIEVDQATFTFSSNEPGSTFTCSLDGGTPEPCDSGSKTYTGLSEGAHAFSVAATGPAPFTKVDPTPATRNFTYTEPPPIDSTPPETTIDSGPAEGSTIEVDQATFTFSSNEPGSTFTCSLDGGTPEPCDSGSKTYTGLSEGAHNFSVAATDPAPFSNVDPTPATRSFTYTEATTPPIIDTVAPKLRLKARKVQKSPKKIIVKATCLDEACSLVASGNIKVKVLKKNGKVKKTRKLKLKQRRASGEAGETVKLVVKLNRKTKKLVKKALRKRKASKALVKVRASDAAGNSFESEAPRQAQVEAQALSCRVPGPGRWLSGLSSSLTPIPVADRRFDRPEKAGA